MTKPPDDDMVRVRINKNVKDRAMATLHVMGLTISDAVRMLLVKIAEDRRLPFEVVAPDDERRRLIDEAIAARSVDDKKDSNADPA